MENVKELENEFEMDFSYCLPRNADMFICLDNGDIEGAKSLLLDEVNRQSLEKDYMLQKYQEIMTRLSNRILKEKDVRTYMAYHRLTEFHFVGVTLTLVFTEKSMRVLVKNMIKDKDKREQVFLEDYLEFLYKTLEEEEIEQKKYKNQIKNIMFNDKKARKNKNGI